MVKRPPKSELEKLRATLRTKFKEIVLPQGKGERAPVISFGFPGIDYALRIGGIEAGRVYELAGGESSGKTTLLLNWIAYCQTQGLSCVYIDVEASLDLEYTEHLGVDLDKLIVAQPDTMEEAMEIAKIAVDGSSREKPTCVVVDSFAALCPERELKKGVGKETMGIQAAGLSKFFRIMKTKLRKNCCYFIGSNQLRKKLGGWGPTDDSPGGNALKHYASVRIWLAHVRYITEGEKGPKIADRVRARVIKNKMAAPFFSTEFEFRIKEVKGKKMTLGLDIAKNTIETAVAMGMIKKLGTAAVDKAAKKLSPEAIAKLREKIAKELQDGGKEG